jgi:FKBP-type peptidyl-prolyl cis-trans isomerase
MGRNSTALKQRSQPSKLNVNRVIKGWTRPWNDEGWLEMGIATSALAYGDMGNPSIEPGSTLLLKSLVGIEPPPPPARPLNP